jgi:hypothetical protein
VGDGKGVQMSSTCRSTGSRTSTSTAFAGRSSAANWLASSEAGM